MPEDSIPDPPIDTDIEQLRAFLIATHADIVPELIAGVSVPALLESVETARSAYNRIASQPALSDPVTVPAGGNAPVVIDTDALPTSEKIRRGLAAASRKDA